MDIQHIDTQLLLLVNQGMANALFDILMPALSQQGYLLVIPFVLALVPWAARSKDPSGRYPFSYIVGAVLISCCAVVLGLFAEHALKIAAGRVRPCSVLEGIRQIISCPPSFSMPSGHAISSFAFCAPLFHLMRRSAPRTWRPYPLVLASLIAFSRIYLGVHYPTDVLAGAAIGAAIGLSLSLVFKRAVVRLVWLQKS
ncbi:MAG: phosphatase PAP2 family protein [Nitrospirota bacterium]